MAERTSVLGGDTGQRGLIGGGGTFAGRKVKIVAGVVAAVFYFIIGGIPGLIVGLLLGGVVILLNQPLVLGRSIVQIVFATVRWRLREARGMTSFTPRHEAAKPANVGQEQSPAVTGAPIKGAQNKPPPSGAVRLPDGVGQMRLLTASHSGGGQIAVLLHTNPAEPSYLSAVLEVEGQPSGVSREEDIWDSAERFGRMLAACAGATSLIEEIQLLTRIVPVDPAPHEYYIQQNHSRTIPRELLASYAVLLNEARLSLEQHRNYIVARIPLSLGYTEVARDYGGTPGDELRCRIVGDEMNRLASLVDAAQLHPVRVLGPQRLAALLRSLQDPDYYIDDVRDVDFTTCWQATQAHRKNVVTNDRWVTRVANVPPDAVTLEPVHMRWLAPLLIGVQPSVIRTVSVNLRLDPPSKARQVARRDAADDRGQLLSNRGRVTDGSDLSQAAVSAQRLDDLRPGSGHAGVRWGMCVGITADQRTIRRASELVTDKAQESGLANLRWFDGAHDLAQPFVWPLARGLRK